MPHVLQIVRDATVTALTGLPTTGAHVYVQEAYPWQADQLPALIVTTSADPVVEQLDVPVVLRWDVAVNVTAIVKGTGDLMALLDQITTELQAAYCALASIGGRSVEVVPLSFEPAIVSGDGDQPVARRSVSFVVRSFFTLATSPDTLLD